MTHRKARKGKPRNEKQMQWHTEPYTLMTALRGSEGPNKRRNWRERIQRESNNMPSTRNSPHAPRMFWGEAASGFPRAGTGCVRRQLVRGPVSWVESRLPGRWSLSRKPGDGPPPACAAAERSSHSPKQSRVCSHPANSRGERPTEDSQRTRQAPDRRGGLLDTPTRPGEHRGPTALELSQGTGYTRPGAGQEMRCQLAAASRPGAVACRCRERLPLQPGPQDGDDVGSRAQLLCSPQGRAETIQPCCCSDAHASAGHRAEKWPVRLRAALVLMTTCPILRGAHGATPQPPARRVRSDG